MTASKSPHDMERQSLGDSRGDRQVDRQVDSPEPEQARVSPDAADPGHEGAVTEAQLLEHSYDLVLFPRYLAKFAPRVRIEVLEHFGGEADLLALYDLHGQRQNRWARLHAEVASVDGATDVANAAGVATHSDAFYDAVHAAFAASVPQASYLGFTRCGRPPYAPLFALALLYRRYGRGLYRAGERLPTRWPELAASYHWR